MNLVIERDNEENEKGGKKISASMCLSDAIFVVVSGTLGTLVFK